MLGTSGYGCQILHWFGPRSAWLAGVALSLLSTDALAVNNNKAWHPASVAIASIGPAEVVIPQVRGIQNGLEEAGYSEGERFKLHLIRVSNEVQVRDGLTALLRQPRRPLDVIVATSATETAIAKALTVDIPIVFAPARDPIEQGFIRSFARSETNLTGLSYSRGSEDNAKQLALFKQLLPGLKQVQLLYPGRQTSAATLQALRKTAAHLRIYLSERSVQSLAEAEAAVQGAARGSTDGIFTVCSSLFRGLKKITAAAERIGVPVFGCTALQVAEEGALVSYTPDLYYLGYRGAWYVDRILKGARPQQLPVELPSRFELVVNLKVAERLGLKIPPQMLILADKVFS